MKTFILFFFLSFGVFAQVTHDLNWQIGVTNANLTIDQGDTVRWTWTDSASHTVTSTSGVSTFNSGTLTGNGMTFSYTFNDSGDTDYQCNFHPAMSGTISVNATASIADYESVDFSFGPNPVNDELRIEAEIPILKVEVYSTLGQLIFTENYNSSKVQLDLSQLSGQLFYAKIEFEENRLDAFSIVKL